MKLVPMKTLLDAAFGKYAVPAINVSHLEAARCVLDCAEDMRSPIIVQAAPEEVEYVGGRTLVAMVEALAFDKDVPFAIHLDHGDSYETCMKCIAAGFSSIMFDGSKFSFEENKRISREVVNAGRAAGVTVELELGTIGQTTEMGERVNNDYMTAPDKAKELVDFAQPDCLAVAIGNAHGLYPFPPKLDFERLDAIAKLVKIPLVMHGGTGIPGDAIARAIPMGIAKVNFSTVTRKGFIDEMKAYMDKNPGDLFTMNIFGAGMKGFYAAVKESILYCKSENRL